MVPKVSIVIPVYNVEKHIEKCVRSLFDQTLDNLEYIFIDDCTPDKSIWIVQRILDDYPNRMPQVKFIRHTFNKGVAQSRQDGINMADGEYVIHCDSDDWVEPNMYEHLYLKAKETEADIVLSDYTYEIDNDSHVIKQAPNELTSLSVLKSITGANDKIIHGGLWNKLIKSTRCKELYFPKDINYCEDVFFLLQLFSIENLKIVYINRSFYHYCFNPNSIVNSISEDALMTDRRLIDLSLLLSKDNKNIEGCVKSLVIAIIFKRAFLGGNINSRQFSYFYKKYSPFIWYNNTINKIDKMLLWIALHGFKRVSIESRKCIIKLTGFIRNK